MKKFAFILVTALATLFNTALRADDYPTRPITLVAVFGAGSASDTICRIIANRLGPALGQPVIVEDRPGAEFIVFNAFGACRRPREQKNISDPATPDTLASH